MLISGMAIAVIALLTTFSYRLRVGSRFEALTTRLWLGSFGRLLFRSAAQGAAPDPAVLLSRSGAARQSLAGLVAALKPSEQKELGEAPEVICALEQRVRELETRAREIDATPIDAQRATTAGAGDAVRASREALLSELHSARTSVAARRGLMVGTLEEFRVALIRMRAGIADASALRTHLESANRLLAERE